MPTTRRRSLVSSVPGTLLASRYALRQEIGRGGMARVYLADDRATETVVAVKILHPELAASASAGRFRREIRLLEQLRHPSLVPVFDSGEDDDLLFLVMPYICGETLRSRLARERQISLADSIAILRPVANGIDYAHQHGVIHRDIKPSNILLDGTRVLLCDFGIARALIPVAGENLSSSGIAIGTLSYMSPEQALGEQFVDGQVDIYALGCVAFEMLTGEVAFSGSDSQIVIGRHLTETPRPIRSVRPDVPGDVEHAIHSAMAKDPAHRPKTATSLVDLMEGLVGR